MQVSLHILATGDYLLIYCNDEIIDEYLISVSGDANGDGKVSLVDVVQVRKHIVQWIDPNTNEVQVKKGIYFEAIDLNQDGVIGLVDLVRVRKIIVGVL